MKKRTRNNRKKIQTNENETSPTSTVTWTLIFPLSLDVENISVDISLPIFGWFPLISRYLFVVSRVSLLSSCRNTSLSLPSGDFRIAPFSVSFGNDIGPDSNELFDE